MIVGHHCVIHPGAEIEDDVTIGDFCRIEDGVRVGAGTVLRSFIELRRGTTMGADCRIDSYVVSSGDNRIGDRVVLRYGAVIAKGCFLEDEVYFAPRVMTNNLDHTRAAIGGARVGERAFIGTHAVLAAGITIAPGVVVGAQAFVSKSLLEPGVYIGVPARLAT